MAQIKKPELLDGVKQNELYPATFLIPSEDEIKILGEGDFVKVAASGERFWVQIEEIHEGNFIARIDNDLVKSKEHGLYYDEKIFFQAKNIINIS